MQNFRFFKTIDDYRDFIYGEIFTASKFKDNTFYRGLIEFVIEHRAPIFFSPSREEEFSHFTQYFNFVLDRGDYYKNDYIRSMYFAHDFVHMLFENPLRPRDMTHERYSEILNYNEWVASNETETFTYYRIHGMREKSLDYTIMYDLRIHAGLTKVPTVEELLDVRKKIIDGETIPELASHPDAELVFSYLRKFKENNSVWCQLWYENFPEIPASYRDNRLCLPVLEYDKILSHYTPGLHFADPQAAYEKNVLQNVRTIALLSGMSTKSTPKSFAECEETLKKLEGTVIMPKVAHDFHFTYIKNKSIGQKNQYSEGGV